MKRITITHPITMAAKFTAKEHREFNAHVAGLDRHKHHNTIRLVIKNQKNAEWIATMMAEAERRAA